MMQPSTTFRQLAINNANLTPDPRRQIILHQSIYASHSFAISLYDRSTK
jgi:hypothetical protein